MFTGLIVASAALVALEKKNRPVLTVRARLGKPVAVGDSIAVDGVCLTVIERKKDLLRFNLAVPTLKLANFQDRPVGSALNIELPLTLSDPLGGHMVSGHIDGTARLRSINKSDGNSRFAFTFREREWRKFIIARGSVALNGVSLTVAEVSASWFAVEIIPQTLATTNLKLLRVGERVNIELDQIGKYLFNFQKHS
ncbi:MAG: riboflavin synthase [Acidobacteria bacterium]|jgi:riboflavin synthase|nr:riboflavin synthase [Acidobacteriota bacterium]